MRHYITLLFSLFAAVAIAQNKPIDSSYNNAYYQSRMEWFRAVGGQKRAIVFLGNSITERGLWSELLPGKIIMNRGIGGDNTFGMLARLDEVLRYAPTKIFLLIGINDIGRGHSVAMIAERYLRIVKKIRTGLPKTKIYVQSVLPLNDSLLTAPYLKGKGDSVSALNKRIEIIASQQGATFINLHPLFADERSELQSAYSVDGIHLKPAAYVAWVAYLKAKNYL